LSSVRVSLDELVRLVALFHLLRGDILLMKSGGGVCIMVTLYMRMGDIGQSRGCDGEEDKRELHGNVELGGVKVIKEELVSKIKKNKETNRYERGSV
jgi:hypothetical protein